MARFDEMVATHVRAGLNERCALQAAMQEVVLCGLSDGGFFRHAAFYGGTCLKLFYGLDRFSEDLDFTRAGSASGVSLASYFDAVRRAFAAVGREVVVSEMEKSVLTDTESAFVKTETCAYQIGVKNAPKTMVKFEMDTCPALDFPSEVKFLLAPSPHSIVCCTLESLLVGKVGACLFRAWKNRVKGRDWYDLAWFAARKTPLRLDWLRQASSARHPEAAERLCDADGFRQVMCARIDAIDFDAARADVAPFVSNPHALDIWGRDYFKAVINALPIADEA